MKNIDSMHLIQENSEIQLYGLRFMGESYTNSKLSKGWSEQLLIIFHNRLSFLLLFKDNQTGVWIFNEKKDYVASSWKSLDQNNKDLFYEFTRYFLNSIVKCLIKNMESDLYKAVKNNNFFKEQILESLKRPRGYVVKNSSYGIIDENFYRSQNSFIRRNHLCLQGKTYDFQKSIPLSDFIFCTLYKNQDGFVIVYESTHFAKRIGLYSSLESEFLVTDHSYAHVLETFLSFVFRHFEQIKYYFSESQNKTAIFLRNKHHIGHNLWNDLSVLFRLEKKQFEGVDEVVLFGGKAHEVYGPINELIKIPPHVKITYAVENSSQLSDYVFGNNIATFRFADDFIHEELANRIVSYSNKYYSNLFPGKTIVVLGLRFENRTWINQIDGLVEISLYIATLFKDLVVIVDGHDFIGHLDYGIKSHMETDESELIKNELIAYDAIKTALERVNPDILVINSVNNDLRQSISLINLADFFVSPWGAGLAKYKWICNKPGITFTNKWNLKNKSDLHIYDSNVFRQNAMPSIYLDSRFVTDFDVQSCNTPIPTGFEKSYSNFMIDVEALKASVFSLSKSLNLPIVN